MSSLRILALILLAISVPAYGQETDSDDAGNSAGSSGVTAVEDDATPLTEQINDAFGVVVEKLGTVLFFDVLSVFKDAPSADETEEEAAIRAKQVVPLIVVVLLFGSTFFTFFHGWINVRGFVHALNVTRGKYDNPDDPGEISHFQALTSALSATVGLGNIASVAVAIQSGGPGAVVWMMLLGILGMTAKFNECTLAQVYRRIRPDGTVHGGPMYYLEIGLQERGFPWAVAKTFGVIFAVFCIGGSFGGGNMFQANQATSAVVNVLNDAGVVQAGDASNPWRWAIGAILVFLVGLVVVGGIKRIGQVTEKIIPLMCAVYLLAGITILITNASELPAAVRTIISSCFNADAVYGGFLGVLVLGIKRAVFSNEAGVGSAAIAHAAAKTDEPVREGIVAMLGPFIDTVVICTMTALVVIVTGTYLEDGEGVVVTQKAFATAADWFPYILGASVFLFAYSTMISWSYYGEKAWQYLFGESAASTMLYRFTFLAFILLGAITSLQNVLDFSDMMILSMAFPNVIGGMFLAPRVKEMLRDYWTRYQNNEFKTY